MRDNEILLPYFRKSLLLDDFAYSYEAIQRLGEVGSIEDAALLEDWDKKQFNSNLHKFVAQSVRWIRERQAKQMSSATPKQ